MKINYNLRRVAIFAAIVGMLTIAALAVYAQPGTDADPFISLSYLNAATSLTPVSLEGGEEMEISGGFGILLLEGFSKIIPPDDSDSWIVDVTGGEVYLNDVDMSEGHMYVLVSQDNDVVFTLQARQESAIGIPGGTAR